MNRNLVLSIVALIALNTMGSAALAEECKLATGAKKVGGAIVWPFKKLGQALKAIGNKITGK